MATKTTAPEKIIYQGREWEKLLPEYPNPFFAILTATDGKTPHQIQVRLADLVKQPKKKPGELYHVLYNGISVFSHTNWKLCDDKRAEMKKLPQYQKGTFKIE